MKISPLLTLSHGSISSHKEDHCLTMQLSRKGFYINLTSLYTKVSQPWFYWPSELDNSLWRGLSCAFHKISSIPTLEPLEASSSLPANPPPPPQCDNQKYLQALLNVPRLRVGRQKSPLIDNHCFTLVITDPKWTFSAAQHFFSVPW